MTYVIFDLNRTLYDPETDNLLTGAHDLLSELFKRGIHLILISRREPGRADILKRFVIADLFKQTFFVEEKTFALFRNLVPQDNSVITYVIGDYLHEEIRFGNQCGYRTIWLKHGKFSHLLPQDEADFPWKIVTSLTEVLPHICRI